MLREREREILSLAHCSGITASSLNYILCSIHHSPNLVNPTGCLAERAFQRAW